MCRSLLSWIEQRDSKQLRLVFDSMDKNNDGQLSREELEEFAIELGYDANSHYPDPLKAINCIESHNNLPYSVYQVILLCFCVVRGGFNFIPFVLS